jgi:hypothetical protein
MIKVEVIDDCIKQRFQDKINNFFENHPNLSIKNNNFELKTSRKSHDNRTRIDYLATIVYEVE